MNKNNFVLPEIKDNNMYKNFITEDTIFEDAKYDEEHQYPIYIILMHTGTPLAKIIKGVTGSEYSHACISFNPYLNPLYSFGAKTKGVNGSNGGLGFTIQNQRDAFFKSYKTSYGVYVMFVSKEGRDAMKQRLQYFQKNKKDLKYDIAGLVQIFFGKSSDYKQDKFFCSRFVMDLIQKGTTIDKTPSLWKPDDIKQLTNISLVNKGDDFYHYSNTKTIKNVEKLKQASSPVIENNTELCIKSIEEYINSHPSLNRVISMNEDGELYHGHFKLANINISNKSDISKVYSLLEYCNKYFESTNQHHIKIGSSPLQEGVIGSLYIVK